MPSLHVIRVEVKALWKFCERVVEVVLEAGDVEEVRGVTREVAVEELVKELECGSVLFRLDRVGHHLGHLLEVPAVLLVDEANVVQQIPVKHLTIILLDTKVGMGTVQSSDWDSKLSSSNKV